MNAAGAEIEPPVDSAIAICGMSSAAIRPPAPPDEPPHERVGSSGFLGILYAQLVENVPCPNSSCAVFPTITPPCSFNFLIAVASKGGM